MEPEPRAKRTVEGDLGVYVNASNITDLSGDPAWEARMTDLQAMPSTEREKELTRWLCARAVEVGAKRHAGVITDLYTPTGKKQIVKGKDLTGEVGGTTGGALTRIEGGAQCLRAICRSREVAPAAPQGRPIPHRPELPLFRAGHPCPGLSGRGEAHLRPVGGAEGVALAQLGEDPNPS